MAVAVHEAGEARSRVDCGGKGGQIVGGHYTVIVRKGRKVGDIYRTYDHIALCIGKHDRETACLEILSEGNRHRAGGKVRIDCQVFLTHYLYDHLVRGRSAYLVGYDGRSVGALYLKLVHYLLPGIIKGDAEGIEDRNGYFGTVGKGQDSVPRSILLHGGDDGRHLAFRLDLVAFMVQDRVSVHTPAAFAVNGKERSPACHGDLRPVDIGQEIGLPVHGYGPAEDTVVLSCPEKRRSRDILLTGYDHCLLFVSGILVADSIAAVRILGNVGNGSSFHYGRQHICLGSKLLKLGLYFCQLVVRMVHVVPERGVIEFGAAGHYCQNCGKGQNHITEFHCMV